MKLTALSLGLACALALLGRPLAADTARPDEDSLFGGASSAPVALSGTGTAVLSADKGGAQGGANSDKGGLSPDTLGHDDFANGSVKDDALQIGGTIYQQWIADESLYESPGNSAMSMPLQVDTYLDVRPNDRLRAYIDGRLMYDPTRNALGNSSGGANTSNLVAGSSASVSGTSNPGVVLDQAWVNFDVVHKAFVTIGKQHVKWGTGHIWNPTDFLSVQKLNPLQPYDLRLGNNMVKVQMPVQGMTGTNLYAIALIDNPQPAGTVGRTGGAFRAETLVWGAEVGVDMVSRAGAAPAYGADLSTPLGPFDVYAETALLSGQNYPDTFFKSGPYDGTLASYYGVNLIPGPVDQSVAGITYDFPWKENRQATLGAEYFYNELGVDTAKLLPILIYQGLYTPFYMGKNYASIYLSAQGPDEGKKTSYNLSTIANLSDLSFVSRLDFTWVLLDYLTFGAWATAHYGTPGGELNFALDTPAFTRPPIPAVHVLPVPVELGMSLRMSY